MSKNSKTKKSIISDIPSSSSIQQMLTNEKIELFSTDSEMDSFFEKNQSINYKYNDLFSSSSSATSPNKTDPDNNEINDDEFDQIVSDAQR